MSCGRVRLSRAASGAGDLWVGRRGFGGEGGKVPQMFLCMGEARIQEIVSSAAASARGRGAAAAGASQGRAKGALGGLGALRGATCQIRSHSFSVSWRWRRAHSRPSAPSPRALLSLACAAARVPRRLRLLVLGPAPGCDLQTSSLDRAASSSMTHTARRPSLAAGTLCHMSRWCPYRRRQRHGTSP